MDFFKHLVHNFTFDGRLTAKHVPLTYRLISNKKTKKMWIEIKTSVSKRTPRYSSFEFVLSRISRIFFSGQSVAHFTMVNNNLVQLNPISAKLCPFLAVSLSGSKSVISRQILSNSEHILSIFLSLIQSRG